VWNWQLPNPPGDKEVGIPDTVEVEPYGLNGPYDTAIETIEDIEGHENGRDESGPLWNEPQVDEVNRLLAEAGAEPTEGTE
jgi:hypothetical protein